MINTVFILLVTLALAGMIYLGTRILPGERWQMVGAVPVRKNSDGTWQGVNITWYGVLNGISYTLATAMVLLLLGSIRLPLTVTLFLVFGVLGLCIPASSIVARIVEKKKHTFSVGGAAFVGILATPWIALVSIRLLAPADTAVMPVLAAISIAYALGEGTGRLACLSFGCCYGRAVRDLPVKWRSLFSSFHLVFQGRTKKIAYASNLDGVPVVPIQVITAVLYCTAALLGLILFLGSHFIAGFLLTLMVTQGWRFLSEFLRADYRGAGRISAYQKMGLISMGYGLIPALILGNGPATTPDLAAGLALLWTPGTILVLQGLFLLTLLYTGRSDVTGSTLDFHVEQSRI